MFYRTTATLLQDISPIAIGLQPLVYRTSPKYLKEPNNFPRTTSKHLQDPRHFSIGPQSICYWAPAVFSTES